MSWELFIFALKAKIIPDIKQKKTFFALMLELTEWGRKRLQRAALEVWEKLPLKLNDCSYFKLKNMYRQSILNGYN